MLRISKIACLILCGTLAQAAQGQLYRYLDPATGWIVYTNRQAPILIVPENTAAQAAAAVASGTPDASGVVRPTPRHGESRVISVPSGFPRVTPAMQTSRDSERRRILDDELQSEQAALTAALQGNAASDIVQRHRSNIAALERELHNTR